MSKIVDTHCPGDDPSKKRSPELFECPKCGGEVEIWTDEESGKCSVCHAVVYRKDLKESP